MGITVLRIKNWVKSTSWGRILRDAWQRKDFYSKKNALSVIKHFQSAGIEIEVTDNLINDMMHEAKDHNVGFNEYLMYGFAALSEKARREFIPTRERITYCERINGTKNYELYDDKAATYKMFKKYYHRDFLNCSGHNWSVDDFYGFIAKHPQFIVKPFSGANGISVRKIDTTGKKPETVLQELKKQYPSGFYAEELVCQSKEMAEYHPSSVNTLRIPTIRFDDRVEVLKPGWRVGQGDSVTDNAGSGGILCALDEHGVVVAAADEYGRRHEIHPDSKLPLIGHKIPRFSEAVALAKELALVFPENRYTGWDLALTDEGWIMIEANDRGGLAGRQLPTKKGFRSEMEAIIKELGV